MNIKEMQEFAAEESGRLHAHYQVEDRRVRILGKMAKVTEEVGELAEEILLHLNLQRTSKLANAEKGNLEKEFADVIITAAILASDLGIDLDKVIATRIEDIRKRNYKE